MSIQPYKVSKPRAVNTIFGVVMVDGPFADDYTRLNWCFEDHRDGETARFRVAGLEAYVADCDGDFSVWHIKDCRMGNILAKGADYGFDPNNFFACLVLAETALREEIARRKKIIVNRAAPSRHA